MTSDIKTKKDENKKQTSFQRGESANESKNCQKSR